MKKAIWVTVGVLTFMLAAGLSSAGVLSPSSDPYCKGLQCTDGEDCGTLCFCNNPLKELGTGKCYPDSIEQ